MAFGMQLLNSSVHCCELERVPFLKTRKLKIFHQISAEHNAVLNAQDAQNIPLTEQRSRGGKSYIHKGIEILEHENLASLALRTASHIAVKPKSWPGLQLHLKMGKWLWEKSQCEDFEGGKNPYEDEWFLQIHVPKLECFENGVKTTPYNNTPKAEPTSLYTSVCIGVKLTLHIFTPKSRDSRICFNEPGLTGDLQKNSPMQYAKCTTFHVHPIDLYVGAEINGEHIWLQLGSLIPPKSSEMIAENLKPLEELADHPSFPHSFKKKRESELVTLVYLFLRKTLTADCCREHSRETGVELSQSMDRKSDTEKIIIEDHEILYTVFEIRNLPGLNSLFLILSCLYGNILKVLKLNGPGGKIQTSLSVQKLFSTKIAKILAGGWLACEVVSLFNLTEVALLPPFSLSWLDTPTLLKHHVTFKWPLRVGQKRNNPVQGNRGDWNGNPGRLKYLYPAMVMACNGFDKTMLNAICIVSGFEA
ncbi:hypothetical protein GQR58_008701 [Nymphon striatum]|nr:hypothetical protein GQR58_008701 [Nymphon striatum]